MILNGKNIFSCVLQSLIGFVIYIDKCGNCHGRIQAFRIYRIAVVLRRNVYSSGFQILNRMISSPVSIFQFEGVCSCCQRHQLMTKTDRKNRCIGLIQLPDFPDNLCIFLGISRSIWQHNAIGTGCQNLFCRCITGINRYLAATLNQRAGNIFLCSQVQKRNPAYRLLQLAVFWLQHIFLFTGGCLYNALYRICLNTADWLFQILILSGRNHTVHGSLFS